MNFEPLFNGLQRTSLVKQIMLALLAGIAFAYFWPGATSSVALLGKLFISALKAVAPVLVFILVMASISNHRAGEATLIRPVLWLYAVGTLTAATVGVAASMLFPSTLVLNTAAVTGVTPPSNVQEVLHALVLSAVDNPVNALLTSNYIGVLVWAVALGMALRHASAATRQLLGDLSDAISSVIQGVIRCAPLGIFGLVAATFAEAGTAALLGYVQLLSVLVGCMLFVALVVNPLIVYAKIRRNPYPLVFLCLRESAVTAFFTRSSAANIPINLALAKRLNLDDETSNIAIPLGATINMAGASITISVLSLAAAHTLGITADIPTAILLCVVASLSACGAAGVPGGSLLLIPLACSLFGIPSDVSMQVVAIGYIISIVQDSAETALNSSTDVLFTAAACLADARRQAAT